MASKKSSKASKAVSKTAVSKTVVSTTAVRNTAIPKAVVPAAPAPAVITYDAIAQRAYQIWSSEGGDERSNWLRAEAELRSAA